MIAVYGVTIFVSAGLLFLIQPMIAKAMLPTFGGTPQVWTASMVFFQGVLLLGYSYAHLTTQRLAPRTQAIVHAVVLALPLVALPIALRGTDALDGLNPAIGVLVLLALSVGLPYVVLSSTSPLLQRWFSSTDHPAAADPYFLYAASNAGSLLGLLAYPFLVEPLLAVDDQGVLWSGGYILFAALCAACGLVMTRRVVPNLGRAAAKGREVLAAAEPPPTLPRQAGWVLRAFVPTSLLLAVTTFLQTDIAAVPLLWVIPLALYLLTFILAFSPRNVLPPALAGRLLPFLVVATFATILARHSLPIWATMGIQYLTFFVAAMLAHGQLAQDRPRPAYLTRYFLLLAVGGVLGGIFNALVAPSVFDDVLEYPLLLVIALLLRRSMGGALARTAAGTGPAADERMAVDARPEGTARPPVPVAVASAAASVAAANPIPAAATLSLATAGASANSSAGTIAGVAEPDRWPSATIGRDRAGLLDLIVPALVLLGVLVGLVALRVAGLGVDGVLVLVLVAIGALVTMARPVRFALIIAGLFLIAYTAGASPMFADRTFFGVHRVIAEGGRHLYLSGATIHGAELMGPDGGRTALSYYHPTGPAGQVFGALDERPEPVRDVAIIGLGAGGLAAYAQAGQSYTFYEIDPVVIQIASDPDLFTFLSDIRSQLRVVEGDGRLRIAEEPDGSFDVLVLDAFSSDAIPAHLVTREAFELYLRKLRPGGILLANVTNSWLDVRAVVAGGAQAAGLVGRTRSDTDLSVAPEGHKELSTWVVAARSLEDLGPIATEADWQPLEALGRTVLWTDDFSDVLSVIR